MKLPITLDRPLVFLDLETTGLSVSSDRIIELALLMISPGGDVSEKVRRFDPGMPIPPEATAVHGITDEDVAGKPPFAARARSLADQLDACDLGGFNIRRFDLPMLLAEFRRADIRFDARTRRIIDVQTIFHREERRDLSAAARFYLDRDHQDAHSALGDIRTTAAVFSAQLERYDHLPRSLDDLHDYCDEVAPFETEVERWFGSDPEKPVFARGKHRGRALDDVARSDADYLRWMLGAEDMDPDVLDIVRDALSRLATP